MKAGEITPQAADRFWYPYIPLGKITAIATRCGRAAGDRAYESGAVA